MISVQNMNDLKDLCKHLFSAITLAPNVIAAGGQWEVIWIFDPTDEVHKEMIYEVSADKPYNTLATWYKSWRKTRNDGEVELFVPVAVVKDTTTKFPVLIFFGSLGTIEYVCPAYGSNDEFSILSKFNLNLIRHSPPLKDRVPMRKILSNLIQDLHDHMKASVYKCMFATENIGLYITAVSEWMSGNIS